MDTPKKQLLFTLISIGLYVLLPPAGAPLYAYGSSFQQDTTTQAADPQQAPSNQQDSLKVIRGKVTDPQERPLTGVTVQLKGQQPLTQTGSDGGFEVQVPADTSAMLEFSMWGSNLLKSP